VPVQGCTLPFTVHFILWLCLFSGEIDLHQKKLQEAKFEIITSEASYINSLNVLQKHFMSSLELCDESVLSKNDRRILFSNLKAGNLTHGVTPL
jgi:hypothetical protein